MLVIGCDRVDVRDQARRRLRFTVGDQRLWRDAGPESADHARAGSEVWPASVEAFG